jgi:hypothetical protein
MGPRIPGGNCSLSDQDMPPLSDLFMAPLQLNKLCPELDHNTYCHNFCYIFCSSIYFWFVFNIVLEDLREQNRVLTSGGVHQSCRREATHERGAEIKRDSTLPSHFLHQLLLEDASSHPRDKRSVLASINVQGALYL